MKIHLEELLPLPLKEQDTALSGIWNIQDLILEEGVHYQVSADSGHGKTTLLSIFYGIRTDYEGKVSFDGQDIRSYSRIEWPGLRKKKLAFIFQGLELFPDLTARENIQLKNGLTGFHSPRDINEMAERLGIEAYLDRKAAILSFGQQQRVAIVRALCQPYEFLLADEPFSHMDDSNQTLALELIMEKSDRQGASCVITSLAKESLSPNCKILKL